MVKAQNQRILNSLAMGAKGRDPNLKKTNILLISESVRTFGTISCRARLREDRGYQEIQKLINSLNNEHKAI